MTDSLEHRNNHYVPLFMIRRWERKCNGSVGVFVFRRERNEQRFLRRNKRRPYPFAVSEDLYVPSIDRRRDVVMEAGWLNGLETSLSKLIIKVNEGTNSPLVRDEKELTKIGLALFSLEHRSRFDLQRIRAEIQDNPELREQISANPDRDLKRLVLENLVHIVTELHGRNVPLHLTFLHAKKERYILTDRPGFNVEDIGRFMVLSDRLAVRYQKASGVTAYSHQDADDELVKQINRMLSLRARDWIVADNMSSLEAWVAVNSSAESEEYRVSEKPVLMRPINLASGFSFREPRTFDALR